MAQQQFAMTCTLLKIASFLVCCSAAPIIPKSEIQTLANGLYDPEDMLLDLAGGKMYFEVVYGDPMDLKTKIQWANLDGSQVGDYKGKIPGEQPMQPDCAVDVAAGKKYRTVAWGQKVHSIERANLDNSDKETLVTNLPWPTKIALDVKRGKVYWIDNGFPTYFPKSVGGSINRANLDGSKAEVIMEGNASWHVPDTITLDVEAGKMYLNRQGFISRADLDGSAFEDVVATGAGPRMDRVSLDKKAGWLYWAQPDGGSSDGTIKRVAFNFGLPESVHV